MDTEEARKRAEAERLEQEAEQKRLQAEQRREQVSVSRARISEAGYAWYSVLGVSQHACQNEVKQAFRELALLHHPDKSLDGEDYTFKQVLAAFRKGLRVASGEELSGSY